MSGQSAINMLARDISSMGFKYFLDTTTIDDTVVCTTRLVEGTYLRSVLRYFEYGINDSEYDASFLINSGKYIDEIEIFRAKMRDAFTLDSVQRVTYGVSNGALQRKNGDYLRFLNDWDPATSTSKKVTICHVPPGNPENAHTITISINAVQTHLDHHDDYLGGCVIDYPGPSIVDENRWTYYSSPLGMLEGVVALKFNFSEDFVTWESVPSRPEEVNFVRIYLLLKSEREGSIINSPVFNLGVDENGNTLTYTVPEGNKYFYRLYERSIEVPSNGRL